MVQSFFSCSLTKRSCQCILRRSWFHKQVGDWITIFLGRRLFLPVLHRMARCSYMYSVRNEKYKRIQGQDEAELKYYCKWYFRFARQNLFKANVLLESQFNTKYSNIRRNENLQLVSFDRWKLALKKILRWSNLFLFGSGLVNPRLIFKIKLQSLICSIFRAIYKIKSRTWFIIIGYW